MTRPREEEAVAPAPSRRHDGPARMLSLVRLGAARRFHWQEECLDPAAGYPTARESPVGDLPPNSRGVLQANSR